MTQLLEDYKRRLKTTLNEIRKGGDDRTLYQLRTKAGCYLTFISEMERASGPKEMTIDQLMEAELALWRWRLEQDQGKTVHDAVSEGVNDAVISTKITLPRDFKRGEEIDFHIHMQTEDEKTSHERPTK